MTTSIRCRLPGPLAHLLVGVLVTLASTSLSSTAQAGGWTQPAGQGYAKIWAGLTPGGGAYDLSSKELETQNFLINTTNFYGEYGLTDQVTLIATGVPYGGARYGDRAVGFVGPLLGGARLGLWSGPVELAAEVRMGGEPGVGETNLAAEDEPVVFIPSIASGRGEWEVQLGYGLPFGWSSFAVGNRWYTREGLHPTITGFAQIGANLPWNLVADLHFTANLPLGELDVINVTGAGNTRYVGFGLGFAWWLHERVALNLSGAGAFYAQSNAYAPVVHLGMSLR